MKISSTYIGANYKPFIIAEMSGNHNQSLNRALEIVEAAAESGASAIKLQTYTAETITLDVSEGDFFINDKKSLWKGESLFQLYKKAYTPWEWHKPIMDKARELGILCFSSPFDETAVDFLDNLNVPAYKIASFENSHIPLIKKVASKKKPIIISSGMATIAELDETIRTIREFGCKDIVILKCTSTYPAPPEDSNILTIPHMKKLFGCEVGLSDHTMGIGASIASVAQGATVIEKHFTLKRSDGGVDSAFSMEPEEMRQLVFEANNAWESLGKVKYGISKVEESSVTFRRSIYISEDMQAGEIFSKQNIRVVRPGSGLEPKYYELLIGKKLLVDSKKGTPLSWEIVG
tara:strand:+ start:584 stop:1627 length:1044 start_codon:yes stop_codon:yes gene_type:complete